MLLSYFNKNNPQIIKEEKNIYEILLDKVKNSIQKPEENIKLKPKYNKKVKK